MKLVTFLLFVILMNSEVAKRVDGCPKKVYYDRKECKNKCKEL